MPRILLSYRRADTAAITGRIFDRLVAEFGKQSVFMDIDNVPISTDFREYVSAEIAQSNIVVAVIGPQWLKASGAEQSRLDNPEDFVRVEIEEALARKIPVIPALVDGTSMPKPNELPASLGSFAFINAVDIAVGKDFHLHMERLIKAIRHETGDVRATLRRVRIASGLLLAIGAYFIIFGLKWGRREDLVAAVALTGLGYWFGYRNLKLGGNLLIAMITTVAVATVTASYTLLNFHSSRIDFFVYYAVPEMICVGLALYIIYELYRLTKAALMRYI